MADSGLAASPPAPVAALVPTTRPSPDARVQAIVRSELDGAWRLLRRLGIPEADVDDAVQRVFLVVARRVGDIEPGRERAFVAATAARVASEDRRARSRRREDPEDADAFSAAPAPDELLDQRRARATLDRVLATLPADLREVFVLFELEQLTTPEIAALLAIPLGTTASRLRRARERFQRGVAAWRRGETTEVDE